MKLIAKLLWSLPVAPLICLLACAGGPSQTKPPETKNEGKPAAAKKLLIDLADGVKLEVKKEVQVGQTGCRFEIVKPGSDAWHIVAFTGTNSVTISPGEGFPIKVTKLGRGSYEVTELHIQGRAGGVVEERLPLLSPEFVEFYELTQEACGVLPMPASGIESFSADKQERITRTLQAIGIFLQHQL